MSISTAKNIELAAAGVASGDPYFKYTALLLSGDGTNGGQNNTVTDSSSQALTCTKAGNLGQGSFTPFVRPDGYWSTYFPSESIVSFSPQSYFEFATGSNTLECWFLPTVAGTGGNLLIANPYGVSDSTKWGWSVTGAGNVQLYGGTGGVTVASTLTITYGQWNHIVMVTDISGGNTNATVKFYINGVGETQTGKNLSGYVYCGQDICFSDRGGDPYSTTYPTYMSNFRWVRSASVYTGSSITVPTSPLTAIANTKLLTHQSRKIVDNSGNNLTLITSYSSPLYTPKCVPLSPIATTATNYDVTTQGGSYLFDGTDDAVNIDNVQSQSWVGSGDWTAEYWAYLTSLDNSPMVISSGAGGAAGNHSFYSQIQSDGKVGVTVFTGGSGYTDIYSASNKFKTGSWHHVAVVKTNAGATVYLDGANVAASSGTITPNQQGYYVRLGQYFANGNYGVRGYISDFRQANAAVYTGSFTPPSKPLQISGAASAASYTSTANVNTTFASSNCQIFLRGTGANIIDASANQSIDTEGNAQIYTSTKKYGTGSLKFDGTGDNLTVGASPAFNFYGGDFTVEFWMNMTSVIADGFVIGTAEPYYGASGWCVVIKSPSGIWLNGNGNSQAAYSSSAWSTGTWYHVAFGRTGSNVYAYVNGVSLGTSSITGNNTLRNSFGDVNDRLYIGAHNSYLNTYNFNGYLDDIRITYGYNRYPAGTTFVPPVKSLPTHG